jgi:hypothetical protein
MQERQFVFLFLRRLTQKIIFVIGIAIIILALTACSGDDNQSNTLGELPTLNSLDIPTTIPSETPMSTIEETSTDAAQPTLEPSATSTLPSSDSEETPEATADLLPNDGDVNLSNSPFGEDVTADFDTLSIGDVVSLTGTLHVDFDTQQSFLVDENDNQIEVIIPLPLTEAYNGQIILVTGEIQQSDAGSLSILPESFNVLTTPEPGDLTQAGNNEGPLFPGIEGTEEATPEMNLPFDISETLDFTLDVDLTALQTYDALVEQISDDIEGLGWLGMSGNSDVGWLIQFYDTDNNQTVTYSIDPEGAVMVSPPELVPLLPNQEIFIIDRDNVVMDSDSVMDQIGTEVVSPFGLPVLNLTAPSLDRIEWIVQANDEIIIDATR